MPWLNLLLEINKSIFWDLGNRIEHRHQQFSLTILFGSKMLEIVKDEKTGKEEQWEHWKLKCAKLKFDTDVDKDKL